MLLHTPNSMGTTILPLFRPTAGPGAYQVMTMHRPTDTPNYKKNDNFNTVRVHIWAKGISSNGDKWTEAAQLRKTRSNTAMTSTRNTKHTCPIHNPEDKLYGPPHQTPRPIHYRQTDKTKNKKYRSPPSSNATAVHKLGYAHLTH